MTCFTIFLLRTRLVPVLNVYFLATKTSLDLSLHPIHCVFNHTCRFLKILFTGQSVPTALLPQGISAFGKLVVGTQRFVTSRHAWMENSSIDFSLSWFALPVASPEFCFISSKLVTRLLPSDSIFLMVAALDHPTFLAATLLHFLHRLADLESDSDISFGTTNPPPKIFAQRLPTICL